MEWVVIDDGSTDNTEKMIRSLTEDSPFPIVYRWQENGGKHRALNHALEVVSGEFFVDIDSDDYLLPGSLAVYYELWMSQTCEIKERLGGMVADSVHTDGRVVGRAFPGTEIITNAIELRRKLKVRGDKLYMYKVCVAREFPSPEFPGENFIQESVRHRRIARRYDLLATSKAGRVKDYQEGGLSSSSGRQLPNALRNPRGYQLRTLEAMNFRAKENARELWKECVNYVRFSFHCDVPLKVQCHQVRNKSLWLSALAFGVARYLIDCSRYPQLKHTSLR